MIHICGNLFALPLMLVFATTLKEKKVRGIWKKANVVPAHKKEEKNLLKNYHLISLLPIFSKVFGRIIYNSLFNHFIGNTLFTPTQSGFLLSDSCHSSFQLLAIIHEIQANFDSNCFVNVRERFLDISKAFDKVWHKGLLFKLKTYDAVGELLSSLEFYLSNREQGVVLNGQTSDWRRINSGAPQGSVLGLLLFLIYINELPDGITSICKIFADDTSLFSKSLIRLILKML